AEYYCPLARLVGPALNNIRVRAPITVRRPTARINKTCTRLPQENAIMATMRMKPTQGGVSRTPAVLYAVLALIGGAAILAVYPPLQMSDEGNHFARAFQVSEGAWRPQVYNGVNGGALPTNLLSLMLSFESSSWHQESRISNPKEF